MAISISGMRTACTHIASLHYRKISLTIHGPQRVPRALDERSHKVWSIEIDYTLRDHHSQGILLSSTGRRSVEIPAIHTDSL